jgi:hypothetical protein
MRIDIHHHFDPWPDEPPPWAIDLKHQGALILERLETIMSALDDLQAAVTAEDTVIDSAITLIQGIPALIAAAGVDPAKLSALQADITAKSAALGAAVAANTPAAGTPATPAAPAS